MKIFIGVFMMNPINLKCCNYSDYRRTLTEKACRSTVHYLGQSALSDTVHSLDHPPILLPIYRMSKRIVLCTSSARVGRAYEQKNQEWAKDMQALLTGHPGGGQRKKQLPLLPNKAETTMNTNKTFRNKRKAIVL